MAKKRKRPAPPSPKDRASPVTPAAPATPQPDVAAPATFPLPRSAVAGIGWPALPDPTAAAILAMHYQLEQSERWSPDEIAVQQRRQLGALLSHARRTIPFYRDRLSAVPECGPDGPSAEDWQRVPLLTRSALQEAGNSLLTRALPREHGSVSVAKTSGATGMPVETRNTSVTGLMFTALNLRCHFWYGRDFSGRVCGIRPVAGDMKKAADDGSPRQWVPGYPSGPMFYFDVTLPVSRQLDWLIEKDPHYLLTIPSNLQALIDLARERGIRLASLREITTMSETLSDATRRAATDLWNVPVRDIYSCEEAGIMALDCPDHPGAHVMAESVYLEVLDDNDRPCAPGQTGRVVITSLNNFATPLIRYVVGDYAEMGGACPCGRGLPLLNRVLGRVRNMVVLPSGERFWPYMPSVYADVAPIRQIQVIQTSPTEMDVRLVVRKPLTKAQEGRLRKVFDEMFHHPFTYRFEYLDAIPRQPNGKFEGFISHVV